MYIYLDGSCGPAWTEITGRTRDYVAGLFNKASETKNANHLQGCNERDRGFLPIMFNVHGGVGPAPAKQWLHSIFAASFVELLNVYFESRR